MYCFLLQPWITIRSGTSGGHVIQSEASWLDLAAFQDIVVWLDVKEVTPTSSPGVNVVFETSPTKEESDFVKAGTVLGIVQPGISQTIVLKDTASQPLLRWLRWDVSTGVVTPPWDITFRIWVAANAPGRRGRIAAQQASVRIGMAPNASGRAPRIPGLGIRPGAPGTSPVQLPASPFIPPPRIR